VVNFLIVCALYAFLYRDEIADCSGQAYDHLAVNDAMEMLMFSSDQQLLKYISEVNVLLSLLFCPHHHFSI
jgi:26S proteasome regulatory subunit N12